MSNFYTTESKLSLAKSFIAEFCGDKPVLKHQHPNLKAIQKMERKYNKSKGCCCDLSDFCIRISEIPKIHYKLMISINWLDQDTAAPTKVGFYKSAYSYEQGATKVEHFITVDKYIQLLFIELNIRDLYKEIAA